MLHEESLELILADMVVPVFVHLVDNLLHVFDRKRRGAPSELGVLNYNI